MTYDNQPQQPQQQPQQPPFPPHDATQGAPYPPAGYPAVQNPGYYPVAPQKSFVVTWLLSLFLGVLGIDRFYLGKIGTGIAKLLTIGGLGIWALIDLVIVLMGRATDRNGQPLAGYEKNKTLAIAVSAVVILIGIVRQVMTQGN